MKRTIQLGRRAAAFDAFAANRKVRRAAAAEARRARRKSSSTVEVPLSPLARKLAAAFADDS